MSFKKPFEILTLFITLFIMVSHLGLHASTLSTNGTCTPTEREHPFQASDIGRYCTQYSGIPSCCDQRRVDETFDAHSKAYPSEKQCSIMPDFTDSCSYAFYPTICFSICASDEIKKDYFQDGKLKLCHDYANYVYKRCGDYRHCDESKACATDEEWNEGCTKYQEYYTNPKAFVEAKGFIYVDGDSTCFSHAVINKIPIALLGTILMVCSLLL